MKRGKWKVPRPPVPQRYRDTMSAVWNDLREKSREIEKSGQGSDFPYLAHSKTAAHPEGHSLKQHLEDVAEWAGSFFEPKGTSPDSAPSPMDRALAEWARRIALHHDAGKYKMGFQRYLLGDFKERVDHATLGGKMLEEQYGFRGRMMAFPVMGHHGGMPNGVRRENGRSLEQRLADALDEEALAAFQREMGPEIAELPELGVRYTKENLGFELSMALRMLFSALVDADCLDTERYFKPAQSALRERRPDVSALFARYDRHMSRLKKGEREKPTATEEINRKREMVREACLEAGSLPQGFFSLTVPTGGGKTLASLGFALRHCAAHPEMERIVYAIPFTSIIEQNGKVFRRIFGAHAVLEHHSAMRPPEEGTLGDLATENWDAPLVVTTNVQLFESLYSNKPSRCRRLHNLRNSVIILDEAQALPDAMLRPCLMALISLVRNYGATVLLCTATQPDWSAVWPEEPEIHRIVSDVDAPFAMPRRTQPEFIGKRSDEELLSRLDEQGRALCIVNARAHAQALYRAFPNRRGVYHLSTLMCPKHREKVLRTVKKRLKDPAKPRCILIATSLVEAGVDIDFPVVYRALAGLDSVVQAAGRCNRGDLLGELGKVYVFVPKAKWKAPPDVERQGQQALMIANQHHDLFEKPALDAYYRQRFGLGEGLDKRKILRMIEEHRRDGLFAFEDIAASFEMIQSAGEPVIIPYDEEGRAVVERLKKPDTLLSALREAREYSVTVYPDQRDALEKKGVIVKIGDAWVLDISDQRLDLLYDKHCGLMVNGDPRLAEG